MKGDAQPVVERPKDHAMSPVAREDRLFLLSPWTGYFSGDRFRDTDRVLLVHEAGPDHQQFTRLRAIEKTTIGDIRPDAKFVVQGAGRPFSRGSMKERQPLSHRGR